MTNYKHASQKYTTLFTFLSALALVVTASLWMTAPYLLGISMAGIFAFLTQPLYQNLIARGLWPKAAAALLTVGILVIVIVPIFFFVSTAVQQAITISQAITDNELFTPQAIIARISNWQIVEAMGFSPASVSVKIHDWIKTGSNAGAAKAMQLISNFPEIILQLLLTSFSYFFLLMDGKKFLAWIGERVPFDKKIGASVVVSFRDTAIASIWATIAAGSAQGIILFLGYLFLEIPGAFLAGIATFIFAWIPILGSTPVWIVGAVYLYLQGSTGNVVLMIIFGAAAGLVDNLIHPLVLKGRSHMYPLVSLIAIFGGIGLFGIMGVFLGPILAAVMIALLQAWPGVGERFGIMPGKTKTPA